MVPAWSERAMPGPAKVTAAPSVATMRSTSLEPT